MRGAGVSLSSHPPHRSLHHAETLARVNSVWNALEGECSTYATLAGGEWNCGEHQGP